MTRDEVVTLVDKFKALDIKTWYIYTMNESRRDHNGESSILILGDEYLVVLSLTRNYSDDKGVFNIEYVPYNQIEQVGVFDINYEQGIQILDQSNLRTEEVEEFLKKMPKRSRINTEAKLGYEGAILDEDGKVTVPKGMSGYVVR